MSMQNSCRHFASMLIVAVTTGIVIIAPPLRSASLTPAEDMSFAPSWDHMRVPKWSNGALIAVQSPDSIGPLIWLFGRSGSESVPFNLPGSLKLFVYDWDRGSDGTIGLSGWTSDSDGRTSGFVAWVSSDHSRSQIIQTGLYRPRWLAIAPDGTFWTAGRETVTATSSVLVENTGVIRHFSQSGQTLASLVPQATIDRLVLVRPYNWLRASRDRVGFYMGSGRYIEVALDGTMLMDVPIKLPTSLPNGEVTGYALTDKGEAFLSDWHRSIPDNKSSARLVTISILNRAQGLWTPVLQRVDTGAQPSANDFGPIVGVDGARLVLSGIQRLKFYSIGN